MKPLLPKIPVFLIIVYMLFLSCSHEYDYPSVINLKLNENLEFDATENQILILNTGNTKINFEIVSLVNELCPEGVMCIAQGYAAIKLKSLMKNDLSDTISLQYPSYMPPDLTDSDSAYYSYDNQSYLIKLLQVKKVFYDKRKFRTKSVVNMEIKSSD